MIRIITKKRDYEVNDYDYDDYSDCYDYYDTTYAIVEMAEGRDNSWRGMCY